MQPTRRELLAGAGAGLAASLAGCAGELTADGAAFGAVEASLSASVQSETGYEHHRTEEAVVEEEVGRFGLTRTVEVTNVVSEYDRGIDLGGLGLGLDSRVQAAVFAVLSTPQISFLGRAFNPVADMEAAEIAAMIQDRYDGLEDVREEDTFESDVAGETTAVTRFAARARLVELDASVDVYLYVSEAVELDDDLVVTVAAHPRAFGRQLDTVRTLMGGVER